MGDYNHRNEGNIVNEREQSTSPSEYAKIQSVEDRRTILST